MCELVPGALTFTELWQVLGLVAPGGIVDVGAVDELVNQLVELVDEGEGVRLLQRVRRCAPTVP